MASVTSSPRREACPRLVPILALGSIIEPLAHPKPGAVTRLLPQADKDVFDFALHSAAVSSALLASCEASASGEPDPVAEGLRAYRLALASLGLTRNVGLGQALITVPLAAALPISGPRPEEIARAATGIALRSTREASAEYYRLLRLLSPGHLGRYRGPLPDVGSGEPGLGLGELLRAVRWDLVASEVTGGYPVTLRALNLIVIEGGVGDRQVAEALTLVLAGAGDTLIARRWGLRAYLASRAEVIVYAGLHGAHKAMELLDRPWRARGWSPGAALDVVAAAIGLYLVSRAYR